MKLTDALRALAKRASPLPLPRPGAGPVSLLIGDLAQPDVKPIDTKPEQLGAYAGWVYAAASLLARDVRAQPVHLYRLPARGGDNRVEVEMPQVLKRPNSIMAWGDLLELTQLHLDLAGEAFWHLVTDQRGRVIGIQSLAPHWVTEPVVSDEGLVAWRVQVPGWGQVRELPASDVVWFRYPHPASPWRGASPVEAFGVAQHFDLYLRAYGATMLRNDAGVPTGILSTNLDLREDQIEAIRERWIERYYRRRDGVAVLTNGATYQPIAIPISDIKFLELGRFNRDMILGIYGVPASKLGLVDDVNRANAEANDATYRANALHPRLRRIAEAVTTHVLPRVMDRRSRYALEFENPERGDPELELRWYTTGLSLGAITRNEYRQRLGLEPALDGDVYLVSTNKEPVAQARTPSQTRSGMAQRLRLTELEFVAVQEPLERKLRANVRRLFTAEAKRVIAAARRVIAQRSGLQTRDWYDELLEESTEDWTEKLLEAWVEGMERGWGLAERVLDEQAEGTSVTWELYSPQAVEYAERYVATLVRGILDTTREGIREVIAAAIREGWGQDKTAEALRILYDQFKGARAKTIARTETARAINWGQREHVQEAARRWGMEVKRRWVAVMDERTRPTHAAAHGQLRDLHEPFEVGGAYLMFPGDPNGPAGETINCRCTVMYDVVHYGGGTTNEHE